MKTIRSDWAAAHGFAISQLALYDPLPTGAEVGTLAPRLAELISAGRRGDAVELFQTEAVGILVASVRVPTLVIDGEENPEVVRHAAQSFAEALPDGRYRTLDGQGHDMVPPVVAPVLEGSF